MKILGYDDYTVKRDSIFIEVDGKYYNVYLINDRVHMISDAYKVQLSDYPEDYMMVRMENTGSKALSKLTGYTLKGFIKAVDDYKRDIGI